MITRDAVLRPAQMLMFLAGMKRRTASASPWPQFVQFYNLLNRHGDFVYIAATVIAYGAAVALATLLSREAGNASAIWPANGLLCAALLTSPRATARAAMLQLCALTNFLVMHFLGDVPAASVAFAIINPLEAFITFNLIQRYCSLPLDFTCARTLATFAAVAGFFGPVLPSITGAFVIHAAYGADFVEVLKTWFFSDALGLLIVIPTFCLLFGSRPVKQPVRSATEIAALHTVLAVVTITVFTQSHLPLLFIVQAIIVRIAFRLGPVHTAVAVTVAGIIAVAFTSAGMGPATLGAGSHVQMRFEIIQLFILVAFYSALPAANAFAEQDRLKAGLDLEVKATAALAQELMVSKSRLRTAINNMSAGLCMYDSEGKVLVCNEPFSQVYGLPPGQITAGMTLRQIIELRIANGVFAGDNPDAYRAERLVIPDRESYKIHQLNTGRSVAIWQRPLPGGGWVTTQEDITEARRVEQRLAFLAHHDELTGLANRSLLRDRVELALARVPRGDEVAMLFLDLDHFKVVNDTFGHATGDTLLKIVAGRLRGSLRGTDTIARLGGDEFAILLVGAKLPNGAGTVAKRIAELMNAPFSVEGQQIRIGVSIGIATAPFDTQTASGLLKCADLALYKAKAEGRGGHRFFENEMDTRVIARQRLEHDLRDAIVNAEFVLHYQPLLDLATDKVLGFEALIRWPHKERGLVSPAEFIPIAEETGLILQIGNWVLRRACGDAATWPKHMKVAVNLARAQLMSSDIVPKIAAILADTGLEPARLQLEITESSVMQNTEKAKKHIQELRSLGVEIAMDDFGTGHSSLSCLRSFPFNKIKIDRAFVNDLTTSVEARSILCAIVSLAKALGMTTTAEGIETAEQLEIVRAQGCNEIQGFFFSKPIPISELNQFMPGKVT